jgi:hypothetical protein
MMGWMRVMVMVMVVVVMVVVVVRVVRMLVAVWRCRLLVGLCLRQRLHLPLLVLCCLQLRRPCRHSRSDGGRIGQQQWQIVVAQPAVRQLERCQPLRAHQHAQRLQHGPAEAAHAAQSQLAQRRHRQQQPFLQRPPRHTRQPAAILPLRSALQMTSQ